MALDDMRGGLQGFNARQGIVAVAGAGSVTVRVERNKHKHSVCTCVYNHPEVDRIWGVEGIS